jgi:hypothetical protein
MNPLLVPKNILGVVTVAFLILAIAVASQVTGVL